jgi:hypothetical protein
MSNHRALNNRRNNGRRNGLHSRVCEGHVAWVSQWGRSGPVSQHQTMVPHFPKMMQTKRRVSDSGKVPELSNGPFNASQMAMNLTASECLRCSIPDHCIVRGTRTQRPPTTVRQSKSMPCDYFWLACTRRRYMYSFRGVGDIMG